MSPSINKARWALARITFITYIGFSVVSLVGGFLTAPLMTWYFFGDWRFWRYWSAGVRLMPHGLRLLAVMFRDQRGFMFAVPLTAPPRSTPDPANADLRQDWPHGRSCGSCNNCCRAGGYACPLLDEQLGLCRGHDSFYWRYFNCGRFPSVGSEIDYYDCRKWVTVPIDRIGRQPVPAFGRDSRAPSGAPTGVVVHFPKPTAPVGDAAPKPVSNDRGLGSGQGID